MQKAEQSHRGSGTDAPRKNSDAVHDNADTTPQKPLVDLADPANSKRESKEMIDS